MLSATLRFCSVSNAMYGVMSPRRGEDLPHRSLARKRGGRCRRFERAQRSEPTGAS